MRVSILIMAFLPPLRHLVQVAVQLVVLRLELPLGGGNGLVDVAQVSQVLVGVSELLLGATSLPVSSLEEGAALLKGVAHGGGLPVGGHLVVGGGRLGLGLGVNLGLGIPHLELVLLDGGLGLSIAGNSVLKSPM